MKNELIPPLLFPSPDSAHRAWMGRLKKAGLIRPIAPRLYTSVPQSKVKETVRGNWASIVSKLFPNALLSHRSALDYRPNVEGEIFLTSTTNRDIRLPGLTLKFIRGPAKLKDDVAFLGLHASSLPRALLENLSGTSSKVLPVEEIEKKLEQILHNKGEAELNQIRDRARQISTQLKWKKEFEKLNSIIGALLGTKPVKHLKNKIARARAMGDPYDSECTAKFELLFGELRHYPIPKVVDPYTDPEHLSNKAFFEAYFSNYIEGTTFEIEEAEEIIFEGKIPEKRPKDAHDILGTYQIVSDPNEMRKTPNRFEDLEVLLKTRHSILMADRPELSPGEYKEKPNRAGNTHFVHPDYVPGTLKKGLEFYKDLPPGIARAIFIMFLVAEVHPFIDGNGRIARIMMNAELYQENLSTIIIPTVYRDDYLLALRALSRRHRATPLIEMLIRAQKFSNLKFSPYPTILKDLQRRNWFQEPNEAKLISGE